MKPTLFLLPATLAFGLMSAQFAQASTTTSPTSQKVTPIDAPPPDGSVAQMAQWQREHQRAVADGDHANDPLNSSSADALNQRELARIMASNDGPIQADVQTDMPSTPPPVDETTAGTVPPMPDTLPPEEDVK